MMGRLIDKWKKVDDRLTDDRWKENDLPSTLQPDWNHKGKRTSLFSFLHIVSVFIFQEMKLSRCIFIFLLIISLSFLNEMLDLRRFIVGAGSQSASHSGGLGQLVVPFSPRRRPEDPES